MHLVYKTTILKRLRSSDQPCPLVLIKHPLIHHLHEKFYRYTLSQHVDFRILDENNNEVIPVSFYLRLLNKE